MFQLFLGYGWGGLNIPVQARVCDRGDKSQFLSGLDLGLGVIKIKNWLQGECRLSPLHKYGFKAPYACFNRERRTVFQILKVLHFFFFAGFQGLVSRSSEDLNDDRQE